MAKVWCTWDPHGQRYMMPDGESDELRVRWEKSVTYTRIEPRVSHRNGGASAEELVLLEIQALRRG
ncbi:hypothetical protein MOQ72_37365 [Saccharopolyspora sp. K220]|nr:hypothetical protein [Saccharopolyspora soli]